jgi:hypothetical protein
MRSFESACNVFGIKVTGRQRRKFARKRGIAYRLADHFSGQDEVSAEAKELYILDMSKPGPNPDKKEKDKYSGNRLSRKTSRNDNKRKEADRQKNHKKNKWRRRKELAEQS